MNNELKDMLQSVIKEALEPIHSEIKGVKSEIQSIKSQMNHRFDTLETTLANIDQKVDVIYEQTGNLTEQQIETHSKLDAIHEDQKSIHEVLGEHEVAIRTFRRKPV